MNFDRLITENTRLDVVTPAAITDGSNTVVWIDAGDYHRFCHVVMVGDISVAGTVDAKVQQATDGTGTGAKDLTDFDGTALTATQVADGGEPVLITLEHTDEQLDKVNKFTHVGVLITVAGTSTVGALSLSTPANYSGVDVTNIDERLVAHPDLP